MKLTVLGAGTLAPQADYGTSAHAVCAGGETLLLDCGGGALQRATRAGFGWQDISRVFLSHLHPDHTLGLPALTFALNYAPGAPEGKTLPVYGPAGMAVWFERVAAAWPAAAPKRFELELHELAPGDTVAGAGWSVRAGRAAHGSHPALAWRVEEAGRSLVYSGDTEYCPELAELARGCDLLLCECSTDDRAPLEGHLSPAGVARLLRESGAGRAVIVHVYPPHDPQVLAARCEALAGVPVRAAGDGDSFTV